MFTHTHLSQNQMDQIVNNLISSPILMKHAELTKINKPLSYLSFTLKEIYEFLTQKDNETGEYIFILRKAYANFKRLKKEEETIRSLIK